MIALLQRVTEARVEVAGQVVGNIDHGLMILLGIEAGDDMAKAKRLAERVAGYRLFADQAGKTNLDVRDVQGEALVISQFTLAADTSKGRRPSFSSAAPPEQAKPLYEYFSACLAEQGIAIETGQFGADMQVYLCNDGPVTIELRS